LNLEHLFSELRGRRIRVALTGAGGGFGRTFMAQCRAAPHVELAVACDRDLAGLRAAMVAMGFAQAHLVTCTSEADVKSPAPGILLVPEPRWLARIPHEMVIEATGDPEAAFMVAESAIERGVHVGMVTKEADSVVGPWLNARALERGVVYTTVDGDQPAALIGLVSWARVLGFDVVAAGKAGEHDFTYDPATCEVRHAGVARKAPGLERAWSLGDHPRQALAARRAALGEFPLSATPDYCEMNVVANNTGLAPACEALSYPVCRATELADVFVPVEDGGVLTRTGVVDVFNALRRGDEASFAGGVFVIVRCTDAAAWQLLREKGHVVSRSGKYACIYAPFHLMGLESLTTVYSAVLHRRATGSADQKPHATMVARARRDFAAGETLAMAGHMHEIDGVDARLLPASDAAGAAPYYLAANRRLARSVTAGEVIGVDALELRDSALNRAWNEMNSQRTKCRSMQALGRER